MLELESLSKHLGLFTIADLDLRLNQGEYFVLLGPSGVGKTVLIEMIAGFIAPDAGRILCEGQDITTSPPEARDFAVVYQDYALFPHLTVAANIAYGLRARGVQSKQAAERVRALTEKLNIAALVNRRIGGLSGGEQQRVALARALAPRPRLLLLDEPLAAVDIGLRERLRHELRCIHQHTGTTFLHVTHDPDDALYLADRVGVMLGGCIRQVATPEELFRAPSDADVAEFLGMRNIMAVDSASQGVCHVGGVEIHAALADESISHIWIKPEEILLSRQPFDSSARNQFRCTVAEWENSGSLLAVRVSSGALTLTALVTYESFRELGIDAGTELYCTFKSSAVHCF